MFSICIAHPFPNRLIRMLLGGVLQLRSVWNEGNVTAGIPSRVVKIIAPKPALLPPHGRQRTGLGPADSLQKKERHWVMPASIIDPRDFFDVLIVFKEEAHVAT